MKLLLFILLAGFIGIIYGNSYECGRESVTSRIFGGTKVKSENIYPWLCQILTKKTVGAYSEWLVCGGSLITNKHILTAAHCVKDVEEVRYYCGHTKYSLSSITESTTALRTVIHESYSEEIEGMYNDIAVVTTKESLHYSPICLPDEQTVYCGDVTIAGWGSTDYIHSTPNVDLMEANTNIVTNAKCKEYWKDEIPVDKYLCTGDEKHRGRAGDSGGPVMHRSSGKWTLLGIMSKEYAHETPFRPNLNTKVSNYLKWIKEKTNDD